MKQYIGLDVSLKDTSISVRESGNRVWRGKCRSDPGLIAAAIRKHAPGAERVVFEAGPLSVWFYHALTAEAVPAICIDARHAKAALDMAANKTDLNDADGLAHLAEVGFYREVRVKSFDSMLVRTLIAARHQMLKMTVQMSNQIRGLMKTFGLVVPKGAGSVAPVPTSPRPLAYDLLALRNMRQGLRVRGHYYRELLFAVGPTIDFALLRRRQKQQMRDYEFPCDLPLSHRDE